MVIPKKHVVVIKAYTINMKRMLLLLPLLALLLLLLLRRGRDLLLLLLLLRGGGMVGCCLYIDFIFAVCVAMELENEPHLFLIHLMLTVPEPYYR